MSKQCSNCKFGKEQPVKGLGVEGLYFCHRFPPKQAENQRIPDPYPFPTMRTTDWCGEYKPKNSRS